jgi:integrase
LIEQYKVWRFKEHAVRDVTVRHDLHALSVFFAYAIKRNWARENPVRDIDIPSDAEAVRIHVITPSEEKEYFASAAKNRNLWDLARLMRNQGMRPEEVLALKKTDVDLDRGTLLVREGKTPAARRTLDLTAESKSILARRISLPIPAKASKKVLQRIQRAQTSPWIFPSAKRPGQHILRLNRAHDAVCAGNNKRASLSFVLYDFRHTFATRLAQASVDLATLAAILGHNSIRIVQKYVHPTAEHKKTAMERYEVVLADVESQQCSNKRLN